MIAVAASVLALAGRIPWKAWAVGALIAAGWWATDRAYERGRADCAAATAGAMAAERLRQAAANAAALRTGADIATTLAEENDRLRTLISEIADESRLLPDSDACGLGSDRLRLLDRIGHPAGPGRPAGGPHP
tara:strand:+ start:2279 stop:2677 length:399 start_codon:yes stop_codon:yes gene_type:complete